MQMQSKKHLLAFLAFISLFAGCSKKDKKSEKNNHKKNKIQKMHKNNKNAKPFDLEQDDLKAFALDDAIDKHDKATAQSTSKDSALFSWENVGAEESKNIFKTIYFEFDKDAIKPEQQIALNFDIKEAKKMIKEGKIIIIEGHACHSAGSAIYNLALSERRARFVAQQFAKADIDASSIRIVGRGTEMPVRKGGSKSEQWVNRRVEIYAIDASK